MKNHISSEGGYAAGDAPRPHQPANAVPPAPGWWLASDGNWYPPQPPPRDSEPSGPSAQRAWSKFRGWPLVAQIACWVFAAFIALGAIGAATGAGEKKASTSSAAAPVAPSTSSSSATTADTVVSLAAGQLDHLHPSSILTPGAVFSSVTRDQVCTRGYTDSVRSVSESDRDSVFRSYGLSNADRSSFEVDHLIPLELGGSNDVTNLWPEPLHDTSGKGAVDKDAIENQLHDVVCSGEMSLVDAQRAVLTWDTVSVASLVSTTTTTVATTLPPTTLPPVTAPPPALEAPEVTTPPPPPTSPPSDSGVYYANCTAARNAGAAPLHRGDPGYRPALDRDGDGIACE